MNLPPEMPSMAPIEPEKSWFGRHRVLSVLLGLGVALFVFIVMLVALAMMSLRSTGVYREALERARQAPSVQERLGTPIEAGWLTTGSIKISDSSGSADLAIPISGPRGKGTIYAVGQKRQGKWQFQSLEVGFEGQLERTRLAVEPSPVQEQ